MQKYGRKHFFKSQKSRKQKRDMASTQETSTPPSSYKRKPSKVPRNFPRFFKVCIFTNMGPDYHLIAEEDLLAIPFNLQICELLSDHEKKFEESRKRIEENPDFPLLIKAELLGRTRETHLKSLNSHQKIYVDFVLLGITDYRLKSRDFSELREFIREKNEHLLPFFGKGIRERAYRPGAVEENMLLSIKTREKYEEMRDKPFALLGSFGWPREK